MKNHKVLGASIFLLILLFVMSCSEDPVSPTNEKENPTEALVTKEIGSNGGTVETENIAITIPPGAFNTNHNIAIYDIADDDAFGENTASSSFKISGLPNSYTKPLKIKIKYSGELSGQSFIAAGISSSDILSGDTSTVYNLYPASDSSGFLKGELPILLLGNLAKDNNINGVNEAMDFAPIIKVITKYVVKETQNFKIHYPLGVEALIGEVENMLETSLDIINNDLGVSYYPRDIVKQTVIIKFQSKLVTIFPYAVKEGTQTEHQVILFLSLDDVIKQNYDELKTQVGKYLIVNELAFTPSRPIKTLWLDYAIITWSEEFFTNDASFNHSTDFSDNAMAPFNGMQVGSGTTEASERKHGLGMSSVIKYLVDYTDFGKNGIGKAYNLISQGADPVTALINNTTIPEEEWVPDFFKKYVNGEIYNQPIDYFLDNTPVYWDINDKSDTSKTFSSDFFLIKSYPDISAKMFEINLNYADIDTSAKMLLSMKWGGADLEGLSLIMFGINNGKAEYLGTANAQDFEIPNLKDYYESGIEQFLAVLVNSNVTSYDYLGKSNIDLEIKVTRNEQKIQFNHCSFNYVVSHNLHSEYRNSVGSENIDDYTQLISTFGFFEKGNLQGNIFTATIHKDEGTRIIDQTVTVEFNADQSMLLNFTMTYSESYSQNGNVGTDVRSISGENLIVTDNNGKIRFSVAGENTCNYITDVDYTLENRYEDSTSWNTGVITTTGLGTCGTNDRMEISFWKE